MSAITSGDLFLAETYSLETILSGAKGITAAGFFVVLKEQVSVVFVSSDGKLQSIAMEQMIRDPMVKKMSIRKANSRYQPFLGNAIEKFFGAASMVEPFVFLSGILASIGILPIKSFNELHYPTLSEFFGSEQSIYPASISQEMRTQAIVDVVIHRAERMIRDFIANNPPADRSDSSVPLAMAAPPKKKGLSIKAEKRRDGERVNVLGKAEEMQSTRPPIPERERLKPNFKPKKQ